MCRRSSRWTALSLLAVSLLAVCPRVPAQQSSTDLMEMSLEDLMKVEVTTIGKKPQKAAQMPAAVTVITQEDIRRSGATNIPEALRLVPGVEVAQVDDTIWAISIRGYNNRSADKLLVMIDGRTVYSPIYTNVFWDVQDTLLEDIERIEVIRGPGATLWGANAVHGVINIITKNAAETQGGLLTSTAGNYNHSIDEGRYGGKAGHGGYYRIFGKYFRRGNLNDAGQADGTGPFEQMRGGFRSDWNLDHANDLTVQGDIYDGGSPQNVVRSHLTPPYETIQVADRVSAGGGNLLARWRHRYAGGSESSLQVFYDNVRHPDLVLGQSQNMLDFDFQHHLSLGTRQDLLWGGGFRTTQEHTSGSWEVSLHPADHTLKLFSSFLQDDVTLLPRKLILTAGFRLEHDCVTGFEVQPTARLLWEANRRQSLWMAVSRAVRTPGLFEMAGTANVEPFADQNGTTNVVVLRPTINPHAEELIAYEFGYRVQASQQISFDLATFKHRYHHAEGATAGVPEFVPQPSPHIEIPYYQGFPYHGGAYGFELEGTYVPGKLWKLTGSYSWLRSKVKSSLPPDEVVNLIPLEQNPQHQFQLHSEFSLPHGLELGQHLYYVASLRDPVQPIASYLRADLRVGWQAGEHMEFSAAGQNLLQPRHFEFPTSFDYVLGGEVTRSVYGKVTWKF